MDNEEAEKEYNGYMERRQDCSRLREMAGLSLEPDGMGGALEFYHDHCKRLEGALEIAIVTLHNTTGLRLKFPDHKRNMEAISGIVDPSLLRIEQALTDNKQESDYE